MDSKNSRILYIFSNLFFWRSLNTHTSNTSRVHPQIPTLTDRQIATIHTTSCKFYLHRRIKALQPLRRQSRSPINIMFHPRDPNLPNMPRTTNIHRWVTTHEHQISPHAHFNLPAILQPIMLGRQHRRSPQRIQSTQPRFHQQLQLKVHRIAKGHMKRRSLLQIRIRASEDRHPGFVQRRHALRCCRETIPLGWIAVHDGLHSRQSGAVGLATG